MFYSHGIIVAICLTINPAQVDLKDLDALKALSDLYNENKAKLADCSIEFELLDGFAKSYEGAILGTLDNVHKAEGHYAIKRNQGMYRCVFSDASMLATVSKSADGRLSYRLNCVRAVTDGKKTILDKIIARVDGKMTRGTVINPGSADFFKAAQIPLSVGFPDNSREDFSKIAALVLGRAPGMELVKTDDGFLLDGIKTIRLEISSPLGKRTVWIDPEKGAIPVRTHDEMDGGATYDLHYGDIRLVAGHGWYPFESTTFLAGGRTMRVMIKSIDFERLDEAGLFSLEFPEPVAMIDLATRRSYAPQKIWDLSNLPASTSPGSSPLVTGPTPEPELPAERKASPPYFLAAAFGLLMLGVLYRIWWKRRAPHA